MATDSLLLEVPSRQYSEYYVELILATATTTARPSKRPRLATWIGLFLALFSMIIIRDIFRRFATDAGPGMTALRELLMFSSAGIVLWILRFGEREPLRSIGLGTSPWWKSLLWGVVIGVVCFGFAVGLSLLTHYGQAATHMDKLPIPIATLVVLRAGVVEELFYRGYAIERLRAVGLSRFAAVALPLVLFSIAHWTGGWTNMLVAFVLGVILTAFYLWRKDVIANMIGHFLMDFVANVLPRLAG